MYYIKCQFRMIFYPISSRDKIHELHFPDNTTILFRIPNNAMWSQIQTGRDIVHEAFLSEPKRQSNQK